MDTRQVSLAQNEWVALLILPPEACLFAQPKPSPPHEPQQLTVPQARLHQDGAETCPTIRSADLMSPRGLSRSTTARSRSCPNWIGDR